MTALIDRPENNMETERLKTEIQMHEYELESAQNRLKYALQKVENA